MAETPAISVVVASHDRPLRLRWLLNALEQQTLPREEWEVVVGHDSARPDTERLLETHPLAEAGLLRHVALPAGSAPPGANRNAAWRLARAPVIAFTDDDCRPPADWLENLLAATRRHPGAIVQGRTDNDPVEANIARATHYHSVRVRPPTPWAECCNIAYPREALEQAGGFREETYTGEDTDLAMRVRKAGAPFVAAPEALTYHAVTETTLRRRLRSLRRWEDLPVLIKRHPEMRKEFPMWIFWKRTHVWLPFFLAGAYLGERGSVAWTGLCTPWMVHALPQYGSDPRGRFRALLETPSSLATSAMEFAVLAKGSVKHRVLFL